MRSEKPIQGRLHDRLSGKVDHESAFRTTKNVDRGPSTF